MVYSHIWDCADPSVSIWDCTCTAVTVQQSEDVAPAVCTCDDNYACVACVTWMSGTSRKHYQYIPQYRGLVHYDECDRCLGRYGLCTCDD